MSVMLYKCPGPHKLHGVSCEYKVVEEGQVEEELANGWSSTPAEAGESHAKGSGVQKEVKKEEAKKEKGEVVEAAPVVKKKRGRPPKKAESEDKAKEEKVVLGEN